MRDVAIRVRGLGKRYRIGAKEKNHDTFAGAVAHWLTSPVRNFRRLRALAKFADDASPPDVIWALRDVDFEVAHGEVLGIIGRNGAGKTTVLKILSRITPPTTGRVELRGRVASLLEVGTGFHPELTGRENVYLNGTILGMRKVEIDRKLDAIVAFSGIESFLDTPVKRYSSGMHVRLAFSVAAHLEPEILLVDEVLAVGDSEFRKKCMGKMGEVAGIGRTVLFVSHNMAAIQSLCPRTMVLADGRIAYDGPTTQAIERYLKQDQSTAAAFDLADFRTSRGPAVLRAVSVTDADGNERRVFPIGSDVVLHFSLVLDRSVRDPQIGIGLNNILGTRIFTLRPEWQRHSFGTLSGHVTLRCRLRDLRLVPGQYYLKATFGDRHTDLDAVENIPLFEIMPEDHWGSGNLPAPISQGLILQSADWSHEVATESGAADRADGGDGEPEARRP